MGAHIFFLLVFLAPAIILWPLGMWAVYDMHRDWRRYEERQHKYRT